MRRLAALFLVACGSEPTAPAPIRFLHTFGPAGTEWFNATMAERGLAVESSLVPFARGQQVISEILSSSAGCPDLIRIDSTWLAGLVARDFLAPVPADLQQLDWLPEAPITPVAVPHAIDGLLVLRDAATPPPKSASIADLVAAARAAKYGERPYPLSLRADGYWFLPWLRAHGGEVAPGGLDGPGATAAVEEFAALFGDLVAPPPPGGTETPDERRRWASHDTAYWLTGPWQLSDLPDRDRVEVSALAGAPRGAQLLVVPRCAPRPAEGWRLARELTSTATELSFAHKFANVPSRASALASSSPLVKALYQALRDARPLAGAKVTPLLFDDLNPAMEAAASGDATASEVLYGVRRGWKRVIDRAEAP